MFRSTTDRNNVAGLEKIFPIIIHTFDVTFNSIMAFNMLVGRDASTAEFMFASIDQQLVENDLSWDMLSAIGLENTNANIGEHNSIDQQLVKNDLSWDMLSAIGLENTNANIGEHNSIESRAIEKNPDIVFSGCPCHILHDASSEVVDAFRDKADFSVKDHCVIFFAGLIIHPNRNQI